MAKEKAARKRPSRKKPLKKLPIIQKEHPWRECPTGHHWVRPQVKKRPPSKLHPDGLIPYSGFCRINPSHKSSIYPDELAFIATKYFKGLGKSLPQDPEFRGSDQFDDFIAGWTQYWNEIFKPTEPLDPALVKALIATESSYDVNVSDMNAGKAGKARGLLQITDEAQSAMDSADSEIKDQLVHVTRKELKDPNLNIAAGVRWLFHKKKLADSALGRKSSWFETIVFYKAYSKAYLKNTPIEKMRGVNKICLAYRRIAGKELKK